MSENKGRITNEDFVTALTADQAGVFIRWVCAVMDSVLESLRFGSRQANAAKPRLFAKHATSYASDVNLTNRASSAV